MVTDPISRQAAIKAFYDLPNCPNGYSDTYDKAFIIGVLEELPPLEPKRGKWIDDKCSNCRTHWELKTNYCPNCGAKMEEAKNERNNS